MLRRSFGSHDDFRWKSSWPKRLITPKFAPNPNKNSIEFAFFHFFLLIYFPDELRTRAILRAFPNPYTYPTEKEQSKGELNRMILTGISCYHNHHH